MADELTFLVWGSTMSELSRSEKILTQKTICVLLVRGQAPDGAPIYAYVGVRADKLEEFMAAQKSGAFHPEEYGVVIASGTGEPDAETRQRMEQDYGFDHGAMLDIPDAENATRIAAQLSKRASNPSEE